MSRHLSALAVVVITVLLFSIAIIHQDDYTSSWSDRFRRPSALPDVSKNTPPSSLLRTRVMAASSFEAHMDVYMTVVKDFEHALNKAGIDATKALRVYAKPFPYGFGEVVQVTKLYQNELMNPTNFINDVRSTEIEGGLADVVMLGTCIYDLLTWSDELIKVWDDRPANQKFILVCTVHDFGEFPRWEKHLTQWVARKAVRLLSISEHVQDTLNRQIASLADSADAETFAAGYARLRVDVHVPLLDLPRPPSVVNNKTVLSDIVIQGSIETDRRDYIRVLKSLETELAADPSFWGYLPLGKQEGAVYEVDPRATKPPFHLHLIGRSRDLPLKDLISPPIFNTVVKTYDGLSYLEFYALMQSMQLAVPAFADGTYYERRASSTFAMAIQCAVPLLLSPRARATYAYAGSDPHVYVPRSQSVREMDAVKKLRAGPKEIWYRDEAGFDTFKRGIWKRNEKVVLGLLNGDIMGEDKA